MAGSRKKTLFPSLSQSDLSIPLRHKAPSFNITLRQPGHQLYSNMAATCFDVITTPTAKGLLGKSTKVSVTQQVTPVNNTDIFMFANGRVLVPLF